MRAPKVSRKRVGNLFSKTGPHAAKYLNQDFIII
jgi:hypothetical protein